MAYSRQQKVMTVGILCLLISLMISIYFLVLKKDTAITPVAQLSDSNTRRVFIKDFYKLEDVINIKTQRAIENTLYGYASQVEPDFYTGTVRPNSYTSTLTKTETGNVRIRSLMIDIEPIKVTYSVSIRQSQNTQSVDITCAPKEMQMDQSVACEAGEIFL